MPVCPPTSGRDVPAGRPPAYNRRMSTDSTTLAEQLGTALKAKGWTLAVAESCTGGGLAYACTAVPGSSDWFERGVVTYSNRAKEEMLGIPAALIARHGAVSDEVARAMAEGILIYSHADLAAAITGIAGPGGGSPTKPVGTVWVACAGRGRETVSRCNQFNGDRAAVRAHSIVAALETLITFCR